MNKEQTIEKILRFFNPERGHGDEFMNFVNHYYNELPEVEKSLTREVLFEMTDENYWRHKFPDASENLIRIKQVRMMYICAELNMKEVESLIIDFYRKKYHYDLFLYDIYAAITKMKIVSLMGDLNKESSMLLTLSKEELEKRDTRHEKPTLKSIAESARNTYFYLLGLVSKQY